MKAAGGILLLATLAVQTPQVGVSPPPEPPLAHKGFLNGTQYFRSGTFEAVIRADGMDIAFAGEKRRLEFSKLPVYANDCLDGHPECPSPKPAYCATCVKNIDMLSWDEHRRRMFFAIATDTSKNKPWILAGYDLRTDRIIRYGEFWGGGAGPVAISPSGRYLALVNYGVCGICCTSSVVEVADLTEHRFAARPPANEDSFSRNDVLRIQSLRWINESQIAYEGETYSADECRAPNGPTPRKANGTIRLSDLKFR